MSDKPNSEIKTETKNRIEEKAKNKKAGPMDRRTDGRTDKTTTVSWVTTEGRTDGHMVDVVVVTYAMGLTLW